MSDALNAIVAKLSDIPDLSGLGEVIEAIRSTYDVDHVYYYALSLGLDAPVFAETRGGGLKLSTSSAVGVGEEDAVVARRLRDGRLDGRNDALGVVVEDGWQALKRDVVHPVGVEHGEDFARQCPAGKDQDTPRPMRGEAVACQRGVTGPGQGAQRCRRPRSRRLRA